MTGWIVDPKKLQIGLQRGEVGVWRWQIGSDRLEWTENLEAVHRMDPGLFDGTLQSFRRDLHPDDEQRVWRGISKSIESGEPYTEVYRSAGGSASQPLWIEAKGGVVLGQDGERYLTGVCLDVTGRIKSENESLRRLKQAECIQRLSSYALGPVSFADVMQFSVETAAEVFNVPLTKILQFFDGADTLKLVAGIGWNPGLVGRAVVGIDSESQAGYTLMSSRPIIVADLTAEKRFSGPPLLREHNVRSGMSTIIAGISDRPLGVFGIHDRDLRTFDNHDIAALISIANIVAKAARQDEATERQRLILRAKKKVSGILRRNRQVEVARSAKNHPTFDPPPGAGGAVRTRRYERSAHGSGTSEASGFGKVFAGHGGNTSNNC